jgi:hypothetical protein
MELENQVCSLELAKKIKELGVKQESIFNWGCYEPLDRKARERGGYRWRLSFGLHTPEDCYALTEEVFLYSAFTVAELGEVLPVKLGRQSDYNLTCIQLHDRWNCGHYFAIYVHKGDYDRREPRGMGWLFMETADTEADARAKMLIYLLENKLVGRTDAQDT